MASEVVVTPKKIERRKMPVVVAVTCNLAEGGCEITRRLLTSQADMLSKMDTHRQETMTRAQTLHDENAAKAAALASEVTEFKQGRYTRDRQVDEVFSDLFKLLRDGQVRINAALMSIILLLLSGLAGVIWYYISHGTPPSP